jgi:flagellar biosynthesis GTPase FlhF
MNEIGTEERRTVWVPIGDSVIRNFGPQAAATASTCNDCDDQGHDTQTACLDVTKDELLHLAEERLQTIRDMQEEVADYRRNEGANLESLRRLKQEYILLQKYSREDIAKGNELLHALQQKASQEIADRDRKIDNLEALNKVLNVQYNGLASVTNGLRRRIRDSVCEVLKREHAPLLVFDQIFKLIESA